MSEMVERVARAIEDECAGCDPRNFSAFTNAARAAIAALREPTEAMVMAGKDAPFCPDIPTDVWYAMIDATLKD
jgi:hypothetical protein